MAYGANLSVQPDSDVDLLIIAKNLKVFAREIFKSLKMQQQLTSRYFDGYSTKQERNGIDVSMHFLSQNAFEIITRSYVANLRLFRLGGKHATYELMGFEGQTYSYRVKNVSLPEMDGYRTIVPVAFINSKNRTTDRYHLGIHRDKLLCAPKILYDPQSIIEKGIERMWFVVTENLRDESMRINGKVDTSRLSILKALSRKERMTSEVKVGIEEKTKHYISLLD